MSIWIGDKQNGIELRRCDGGEDLDELVMYIDNKCIMHMEATSAVNYWFGFYLPDGKEVHMNIGSKNLKSHVVATAEEQ
jgi:hypothetical protein